MQQNVNSEHKRGTHPGLIAWCTMSAMCVTSVWVGVASVDHRCPCSSSPALLHGSSCPGQLWLCCCPCLEDANR